MNLRSRLAILVVILISLPIMLGLSELWAAEVSAKVTSDSYNKSITVHGEIKGKERFICMKDYTYWDEYWCWALKDGPPLSFPAEKEPEFLKEGIKVDVQGQLGCTVGGPGVESHQFHLGFWTIWVTNIEICHKEGHVNTVFDLPPPSSEIIDRVKPEDILGEVSFKTGAEIEKNSPVSCFLKSTKKVYKANEDIILEISVQNNTEEDLYFINLTEYNAPWGSAKPVVTDSQGRKINFAWKVPSVYPPIPPLAEAVKISSAGTWNTQVDLGSQLLDVVIGEEAKDWLPAGEFQIKIIFEPPELQVLENTPEEFSPPVGLSKLKEMSVKFWTGRVESDLITIIVED